MVYARLENNQIVEIVSRPDWKLSDGSDITDQHLIPMGYIPVDYDALKPTIDSFYQEAVPQSFTEWQIVTGEVEVYIYSEEAEDFELTTAEFPYVVQVTYDVVEKTLDELKEEYHTKIKEAMEQAFKEGYECQAFGNVTINSDRIDLQNMINLSSYMTSNNLSNVDFRIFDNSTINVTLGQLNDAIEELKSYHVSLYHHKWQKETELDQVTSIDDLKSFEIW